MVYFIVADEAKLVKIGRAANPTTRLKQLQVACPYPLRVGGVTPGDVEKEAELHERFAEHRTHGEWFHLHESILDFIIEMDEAPKEAKASVLVRFTPDELAEIDQARADSPREPWIRNLLLDVARGRVRRSPPDGTPPAPLGSPPGRTAGTPPYRKGYGPDVSRVVGSGRAKQGVEPIPK